MIRKGLFATFIISTLLLTFSAQARDGKAWGGQCIVTKGSSVSSSSCSNEGVSCTGNGRGGVDCTWNGVEGDYSESDIPQAEKKEKAAITPPLITPKPEAGAKPIEGIKKKAE